MRICFIYHGGDYPPYERIDKMAKSLTAAGHEIFLLCNNYGKYPVAEETVGDVHVLRLQPTWRGRIFNRIVKFPIFFNPLWFAQIVAAIRRFDIDVIQVIDLPLAAAALAVGRLYRLPVIMDMWENYPEVLKIWARSDWKTRVFKNPAAARAVERRIVTRMDRIIVVIEEQKDRLIRDGVDAERISVVTNAVDADMWSGGSAIPEAETHGDADVYKLLYAGILTSERGLDDIIRALPLLRERIPRIRLDLVGKGNYEPQLRRLAHENGVSELVRFIGWVPFERFRACMANSDLCLAPWIKHGFSDTTIPNKLFQYMLMGKPVLVSNAKPLARIVRECGGGFVFASGNPASAAAAIEAAYRQRADRSIGERGRRLVESRYTWDKVAPGLLSLYAGLKTTARDSDPTARRRAALSGPR